MPNYDYVCSGCAHELEAFQQITAAPLTECPECKRAHLKRKIGRGSAVLFRGTGFYETDYKAKPKPKKAKR